MFSSQITPAAPSAYTYTGKPSPSHLSRDAMAVGWEWEGGLVDQLLHIYLSIGYYSFSNVDDTASEFIGTIM
jgi:hypothetical protein